MSLLSIRSRRVSQFPSILEHVIEPKTPWKILHHALLLLRTIVLFGSEHAVDKAFSLSRFLFALQSYNSALESGGGVDYGAPIRKEAKELTTLLKSDTSIRVARKEAREQGGALVPQGSAEDTINLKESKLGFGQGVDRALGAGFGIEKIPGMYENRPEVSGSR